MVRVKLAAMCFAFSAAREVTALVSALNWAIIWAMKLARSGVFCGVGGAGCESGELGGLAVDGAGLYGALRAGDRAGKWACDCSGTAAGGGGGGWVAAGDPAATELQDMPRCEAARYSGRGLTARAAGGLGSGTQRERYCGQAKLVWPCFWQSLQRRSAAGRSQLEWAWE